MKKFRMSAEIARVLLKSKMGICFGQAAVQSARLCVVVEQEQQARILNRLPTLEICTTRRIYCTLLSMESGLRMRSFKVAKTKTRKKPSQSVKIAWRKITKCKNHC